jgi:hypothetical protein
MTFSSLMVADIAGLHARMRGGSESKRISAGRPLRGANTP